jgi:hypothetical protein
MPLCQLDSPFQKKDAVKGSVPNQALNILKKRFIKLKNALERCETLYTVFLFETVNR